MLIARIHNCVILRMSLLCINQIIGRETDATPTAESISILSPSPHGEGADESLSTDDLVSAEETHPEDFIIMNESDKHLDEVPLQSAHDYNFRPRCMETSSKCTSLAFTIVSSSG